MSDKQDTSAKKSLNPFNDATNANSQKGAEMFDKNFNDCDDSEISAALTESYSEISFNHNIFSPPLTENQIATTSGAATSHIKKRPDTLNCDKRKASFPYNLEGTVRVDGHIVNFVTENLEYKIKLASPVTLSRKDSLNLSSSRQSTPSAATGGAYNLLPKQFLLPPHLTQIDSNVLNDIELEAQYLAASVDNLTENLCSLLHSISSITADNVETYKNAVSKLTDSMDANIKCMYTIMAKTEEISKAIKPAEQLAGRIRDIKKLVDMFENVV